MSKISSPGTRKNRSRLQARFRLAAQKNSFKLRHRYTPIIKRPVRRRPKLRYQLRRQRRLRR